MDKYPRTFHLPWSPGATSDDKIMTDVSGLASADELVVTEKMDGGNFTMTADRCYSRSPSGNPHPWDAPARTLWKSVRWDIEPGLRVVGESMAARRSIAYDNLPGPFLVFAIFDPDGVLLSWEDTEMWAEYLRLPTVPVLERCRSLSGASLAWSHRGHDSEGYVIRDAGPIDPEDFASRVGKFVRANHVRTSDDWRRRDDYALNEWSRV